MRFEPLGSLLFMCSSWTGEQIFGKGKGQVGSSWSLRLHEQYQSPTMESPL